jgi:hypothetical protein
MPKPTPQEYQEAIQNPSLWLLDPELKRGVCETNSLGLPKPRSGNFAIVFKLDCSGKKYAARFFLRDVPGIEDRYKKISDYLKKSNLPCFVDFQYLEEGIIVRGEKYSVLKMEWIDGVSIDKYIEQNLGNPRKLEELANNFKLVIQQLNKYSISHCDLRDANILISNDKIRLIDYDSMYIPDLKGLNSLELGHQNYQHPQRDHSNYDETVDNFSEWVIYLSILALSKQKSLWKNFNGGDECLLFRKSDFESYSSNLIDTLDNINDKDFHTLLQYFKDTINNYDIKNIVSIIDSDKILKELIKITYLPQTSISKLTDMLKDIEKPVRINLQPESNWIWENKPVNYEIYQNINKKERLIVGGSVFGSGLFYIFAIAFLGIPIITLASFLAGTFLLIRTRKAYTNSKIYQEKANFEKKIEETKQRQVIQDKYMKEIEKTCKQTYDTLDKQVNELVERYNNTPNFENQEITNIKQKIRDEINKINYEIRNLKSQETNELSRALLNAKNSYLANQLRRCTIKGAYIKGIGPGRTATLNVHKILTAADFTDIQIVYMNNPNGEAYFKLPNGRFIQIPGIGPRTAQPLKNWRSNLESRFIVTAPKKLDPDLEASIKKKYFAMNQSLHNKEHNTKLSQKNGEIRINNKYIEERNNIIAKINQLKNSYNINHPINRDKLLSIKEDVSKISWELSKLQYEHKQYSKVNYYNYIKSILMKKR